MISGIDYKQKINGIRPETTSISGRDVEEETESNRGRIIQSPAVRRLQQKTQVFPLEINAAVRTRLTHSMEVQQTSRYLARTILKGIGSQNFGKFGLEGLQIAFVNLVEMAALLHDIGNPPFGHFGETAINEWSKETGLLCFEKATSDIKLTLKESKNLKTKIKRDIINFEGNAQAIRLVHTLQRLNLTFCQTAALLKYTRPAYQERPSKTEKHAYLRKKPGYYLAEESFVLNLRTTLKMNEDCRHPLTYIMEAADDISYCIADLEDGVAKGLMTLKKLKQVLIRSWNEHKNEDKFFPNLVEECYNNAKKETDLQGNKFIVSFRTKLVTKFVNHASQEYIANHDNIFNGTYDCALLESNSVMLCMLKTLKTVAFKYIFVHPEVETLELRGYTIIKGLFDLYKPLLEVRNDEFLKLTTGKSDNFVTKRLFNRLPAKILHAYKDAISNIDPDEKENFILLEWYYRARLLIDYISGMTDEFAQAEYQSLSAIN